MYSHTRRQDFPTGPVCRRLALVMLAAMLSIMAGCSERSAPSAGDTSDTNGGTAAGPAADNGIIRRDDARSVGRFEFVNQHGQPFTDQEIASRLAVVNFIFTTCPGTCPRQTMAMKRLQDRISKTDSGAGIRLISITVDPETDTPDVLTAYAAKYEADPETWHFLTGDRTAIWNFSKDSMAMDVSPNPGDPLIPIAHESKFALIDRTGRIRGYFDALEETGFEQLWSAIDTVLPEFAPDRTLIERHGLPGDVQHLAQPANILDAEWLGRLAQQELDALTDADAVPGFRFTECRQETGITFHPQIVDDQRHRLLVNHYDHGNSLSVADVDNDGHLDLYFVSQVGPNELWRGIGEGRFENYTDASGTGLADRVCVAASFCDIDNDGDPDLYVTSIRNGNVLFENDGRGRFTDITEKAGLTYVGHSSRGTFFDYDRDGLADLYLCNVGHFTTEEKVAVRADVCNSQPDTKLDYYVGRPDAFSGHLSDELPEYSVFYRNMGNNRFQDVTESVGLGQDPSWSGEAIAFDANNDHWQDLYVCNMQGHDRLYINQQGTGFTEQTDKFFPATPWGTMGATICDFDNNGLFDLFLTDMHSDMSQDIGPEKEKLKSEMAWPEEFLNSKGKSIFGNAFFQQTAPGTYKEISDSINAENYWPWGLSCGDLNADGYVDAFLCSSMCFPYRYGVNSLLLNNRGTKFSDAHFTTGIEPRRPADMIAPWFALDFSGKDSESRLRQNREGTAIVWSATGTRSSVLIDFDDDGDLDIITNEFNTPPQVFRSNLNEGSAPSWLKIRLIGTSSGRDALGAVVIVETDAGTRRQLNNGATGYLSQSVMPLYFGLADQQVKRITVVWPNGVEQTMEGPVEVDRTLVVTQTTNDQ
ncbi:MAG: FG-GAP-like repeat-containing protein [Fuerstiella sp.]